MAVEQLTPRQQEIRDLVVDEGLKAPEIAQRLGISESAVYSHLRVLRQRKAVGGAARSGRAKSKPKPKPSAKPVAPVDGPAPMEVPPLTAIRARGALLKSELADSEGRLKDAKKIVQQIEAEHNKLRAKHAPELRQLDAAERALTGKKSRGARKAKAGGAATGGGNANPDGAAASVSTSSSTNGAPEPEPAAT